MKKVVCLGGGNAMPKAVLKELKNEEIDLSVISATLDSGGSSGKLRDDLGIIAPGDLRRAFLELSTLDEKVRALFDFRFEKGVLKEHNLGNLIMAAVFLKEKEPIKFLNYFFKTKFFVFPATLENANLCAELENGEIIEGEMNIDVPKHNSKIRRVFLSNKVSVFPEAAQKLKEAEAIIIGPGDLYSSLIQILLVSGISDSIRESKAKVIYICNTRNKKGETDNFTVDDYEREIEKYLGRNLDYLLFNNSQGIDFVKFNSYNDLKHIGLNSEAIHNSKEIVNQLMKLI